MKKSIKSIVVMVAICSVMALLLAITNGITAPIIEKNAQNEANKALLQVMPNGNGFELVELSSYTLPQTVQEVYKEANGGYVITLKTAGYGSDMNIMCGIGADGILTGALCLSSNETLGKEKTYGETFVGKNLEEAQGVDTITGATKTTQSYKDAIVDAMNAIIILNGGSVDLRSEEEILAENLATALPQGEGKFTELFLTQETKDLTGAYVAENGSGFVGVVGDIFVGFDANYQVVSEYEGDKESLSQQIKILHTTTFKSVQLPSDSDLVDYVVSAQKTNGGTYVLEVKGAGYGIKGGNEYHPASGEYIVVKVALTSQGKILDCITISQKETDGIGSACADATFYSQFKGKEQNNYTQIDAIGGATMTTNGYLQAIERAFEAVTLLEGGAK